ncbi:restriction endonuclease subunit S [Streptococcus anginosus]|uniref:restriction endonuclease subunit S n=1 Tax=Streptococcus anginosus TaxID=1328 RepID=UPI0034A55B34
MEKEKNKERIPQLRFPEFKNAPAWEQRKLGEVAERFDNLRIPVSAQERSSGTTPYYGANGIQDYIDGYTHDGEYILIAEDGANDLKDYPIQYVNGKVWVNNHAHVVQGISDFIDNKFLLFAMKQINVEPFLVGGGRAKLNADILMKLLLTFPSLPEQKAIGDFFSTLDRSIALHQRELENLKNRKKSLLQKMFPKNGESVPKIRFPEFKNAPAWEQRKSDKIFQSVSDKNHPDLPVLSASQELGMVKRDDVGIDIKYDKSSLKNYKRVVPGQFVIHLRSFQGGFAHSIIEGITSPAYTILDFVKLDEHSDLFWKNILTSRDFIKRLEAVTYGIRDGRSISFSDFSSLNFNFPTLPEQKAIGDFFSTLDRSIALHQRKLEHLKFRKKALLQKMFP